LQKGTRVSQRAKLAKKYAKRVALVTDGSRGIGALTANPGDRTAEPCQSNIAEKSTRYYFDVALVPYAYRARYKDTLIETSSRRGYRHTHTREDETYTPAGELR
jgi:hypothetical protein